MGTTFEDPGLWPKLTPSDAGAARRQHWQDAVRRLPDAVDRAFAEGLDASPGGKAMLECILEASPFLSDIVIREQAFLRRFWEEGPDEAVAGCLAEIRQFNAFDDETPARRQLRVCRRQVALATALADIAGIWELEQVTGTLSELADLSASLTLRMLLGRLHARGILSLPNPENPEQGSGLIALALGKLGGRELNYSSDIDLILLFDPDIMPARNLAEVPRHLARLAKGFNRMLSEVTGDGYVFRVDLRLRPDPGSTPPVMSTDAAEIYYEGRGQTWERAALVKARPIAGDLEAGASFLKRIEPFVWRRHLDFDTIQNLHGMKRKIDAYHQLGQIRTVGHDLKLGRGGIREIEFFVQTQQLIWGGRDSRLRVIPTCQVLRALDASGKIPASTTVGFINCYRFLRRIEHRVQMVGDEQTHSLPNTPEGFARMAEFLGYEDAPAFDRELVRHLREVERHYSEFFELPEEMTRSGGESAFDRLDDSQARESLGRLGFRDPKAAVDILNSWRSGRYRVTRGSESRDRLMGLVPLLMNAMAGTADPDLAIRRFDGLLGRLPTGLQIFSLLQANLPIMDTLAELMVSAPALTQQLQERPSLFDALIEAHEQVDDTGVVSLRAELDRFLGGETDPEEGVNRIGRWVDAVRFRTAIRLLYGQVDPLDAASHLSDIADCTLQALLDLTGAAFAARHGRVPGAELAVLSLGKLGSREMSITSDLDLILIYDAPPNARSDGASTLPAATYFNRLLRRLMSGLGARPGQRQIYEIDMRLRPSGQSGPLATSFASFRQYHRESSWTWEKMALTRARLSAGSPGLGKRLMAGVREALCEPRAAEPLRNDVANMRRRMDREFHTDNPWSVKHLRGGIVDIEFVVQYLTLLHAAETPDILKGNTGQALRSLEAAGALDAKDAARLVEAWEFWTRLQSLQRVIREDAQDSEFPQRLRPLIAEFAGAANFADLPVRMSEIAADVKAIHGRILPCPTADGETDALR